MGTVFGKHGVAEPAYTVLMSKTTGDISYEIRRYGQRFAAQTTYSATGISKDESSPFRLLASYIGVFGNPQNDGGKQIAMTAPVAMKGEGKKIAMTAPVMMSGGADHTGSDGDTKTMMFILPEEYKTLESIPKPTNEAVSIKVIPPATGAVHRYSGSRRPERTKDLAAQLGKQLKADGFVKNDEPLSNYEDWGYDPPFTIPIFRRNEIWIELDEEVVDNIVNGQKATN